MWEMGMRVGMVNSIGNSMGMAVSMGHYWVMVVHMLYYMLVSRSIDVCGVVISMA
jgi:hypothetical protein